MGNLSVTVQCLAYDRVRALIDGRVNIDGCDISKFVSLHPSEAFHKAFNSQDYDITEISCSSQILATSRGEAPYVAVPIPISRVFRHGYIYVRTDRIRSPEDLRGKLVGVTEYQITAALWIRGILSDEYGVMSREIRWRTGLVDNSAYNSFAGSHGERTRINLPADIELEPIPAGNTLSEMLADGELDAVVTPVPLACFVEGAPNVGRLFPDARVVEEAYYRKTRMFPIMHLIAIRRSLVERHLWIARNVVEAFTKAKDVLMQDWEQHGMRYPTKLPWVADDLARVESCMGTDFWPYGYSRNRNEIESMLRWSVEQGLAKRQVSSEEIFAPGMVD